MIDRNLRFDEYIVSQCKKAGRKLNVIVRIGKCMAIERRRMLMKIFIEYQFGYCPLGWICCNRSRNNRNNRINHLYERALRIVYIGNVKEISQLAFIIGIHLLGIEMYKTRNIIPSRIMNELFEQRNLIYNLRPQTDLTAGPVITVNNGLKNSR